jgi:hypothetical protein
MIDTKVHTRNGTGGDDKQLEGWIQGESLTMVETSILSFLEK